jgi:regulatory protein
VSDGGVFRAARNTAGPAPVATVTCLEADPRQQGGVRVSLDGATFATVSSADVRPLGLSVGAALSTGAASAIERRAEVFSAHCAALRILTFRALPSREIRRRLVRKGFLPAAAEEAVGALVSAGLINDREFALHYARTRARRFRYGPGRLMRDLERFGIEEREAKSAVAAALEAEGVEPVELLREAAEKKLRALRGLDPVTRRRKLKIYLLRRGYAFSDVIEVVKAAVAG